VRANIETGLLTQRGNADAPADVTVIAHHTMSAATLSPQTTLTITGQTTMNSDEAVVDHVNACHNNRIPPAVLPMALASVNSRTLRRQPLGTRRQLKWILTASPTY
jgi:hypothetical protein